MSDRPDATPDDFEPTMRIDRTAEAEDTSTRKVTPPPKEETSGASGLTGRFIAHFTGMFHRRGGTFEPVPLNTEHHNVSLDTVETAAFPPLEPAYERTEEIGAGGQARLYRGFDLHLHRQVAVKSLREEQGKDPELRGKFVSEAMITAQLDHPAIVPVHSIHRDKDGNLHLAMKLINGRPFQAYLSDLTRHYEHDGFSAFEEKHSLDYRIEVFLSVCDALEYAHNRNIMHCDLKPENIMIGEYHEAYLMDWGIARRINDPKFDPKNWESPSIITGTPRFLSPEAVQGVRCDQRADIYAMGLILYEIVTLQYGYPGSDHRDTINRIRRGEMRPVTHRFGYPIPTDLRKIILKAAAWDREKRYQTMGDLSADLRHFIRGEEVSANPDSLFGRLARWGYRHRRLMLSLVLCAITLGAIGVAYSLHERIKAGRKRAREAELRHKERIKAGRRRAREAELRHQREQARSEFRNRRTRELGVILGRTIGVSRTFDRRIANLENDLTAVTTNALMLLGSDVRTPAGEAVWSRADLSRGKVPPTLIKAPGFGYEIDMDHIVYQIAPGEKPANVETRVRKLAMLCPVFLRALVESCQDSTLRGQNLALLKQRIISSGAPLIDVYLGFQDGLFVLYPCSKILPEDFDHRQRPWYKERMEGSHATAGAMWGSPYRSVDGDVMLPCTLPMIDLRGNFHGVAAIDVSIRKLVKSLRGMGDSGKFLLEKTIVDADGRVVLDIGEEFIRASNSNAGNVDKNDRRILYGNMPVFERIKERRNGVILRAENGKNVAYVFSGMYSVKWYYIEKIDLDTLLRERGVKVPDGMDPGE